MRISDWSSDVCSSDLQKLFFFGAEGDKPIEYVSFRLGLTAPLKSVPQLREPPAQFSRAREIDLFDQGAWRKATMISRAAMEVDQALAGPAILEDSDRKSTRLNSSH